MKSKLHWLVRPSTIRGVWIAFSLILALTVLPDFFQSHHGHFGIDSTIGFHAWYGLGTCVAMIMLAKFLGILLKRKDTYYDD